MPDENIWAYGDSWDAPKLILPNNTVWIEHVTRQNTHFEVEGGDDLVFTSERIFGYLFAKLRGPVDKLRTIQVEFSKGGCWLDDLLILPNGGVVSVYIINTAYGRDREW